MAFPGMLLAIALVAVLGPSLVNVVLALAVIGWVGYARLVRGQVLRAREFEYVTAARALGAGTLRILMRHVLPTALPPLLVQATLGMAGAILSEAALSFLGLGVQPPTPSWGTMINGGRVHLLDAPHLTIFPGLFLAIVVLGFNFLGDGLRDAIDPRRNDLLDSRIERDRVLAGKAALELLKRRVVGLRRQPFIDHLMRAGDVAGAPRRVGEPDLQCGARAGFVDRAIEPAHRERRLAEPHRIIARSASRRWRAVSHRRSASRISAAHRAHPGCVRRAR